MYCLFCVVLCIVFVYMCTVLLPPGGYPIAVKYIISYNYMGHTRTLSRPTPLTPIPLQFSLVRQRFSPGRRDSENEGWAYCINEGWAYCINVGWAYCINEESNCNNFGTRVMASILRKCTLLISLSYTLTQRVGWTFGTKQQIKIILWTPDPWR
jgi:hypothetical protein